MFHVVSQMRVFQSYGFFLGLPEIRNDVLWGLYWAPPNENYPKLIGNVQSRTQK